MNIQAALWHSLGLSPTDETTWFALADWLEENGATDRAELTRLWLTLRHTPESDLRDLQERKLESLLRSGALPCVPTFANSIGMELALVPAGTFQMGSRDGERGSTDELPRHAVTLKRSFHVGTAPVTQRQYATLIGANPSAYCPAGGAAKQVVGLDTDSFPVDSVTWDEAVAFCERLSALPVERDAGRVYRLPTEAEWEYVCRSAGASTAPFNLGESLTGELANFDSNYAVGLQGVPIYLERPTPVGNYPCNALGVYDLHGNVWEWCLDFYSNRYPSEQGRTNPLGPEAGRSRVRRGGSWYNTGVHCRSAYRSLARPGEVNHQMGFRVVMETPLR
jgi:formylglycine-generating enzyme